MGSAARGGRSVAATQTAPYSLSLDPVLRQDPHHHSCSVSARWDSSEDQHWTGDETEELQCELLAQSFVGCCFFVLVISLVGSLVLDGSQGLGFLFSEDREKGEVCESDMPASHNLATQASYLKSITVGEGAHGFWMRLIWAVNGDMSASRQRTLNCLLSSSLTRQRIKFPRPGRMRGCMLSWEMRSSVKKQCSHHFLSITGPKRDALLFRNSSEHI